MSLADGGHFSARKMGRRLTEPTTVVEDLVVKDTLEVQNLNITRHV